MGNNPNLMFVADSFLFLDRQTKVVLTVSVKKGAPKWLTLLIFLCFTTFGVILAGFGHVYTFSLKHECSLEEKYVIIRILILWPYIKLIVC